MNYLILFLFSFGFGKKIHFYTGKWLLRYSNDNYFNNAITYLYIDEKNIIIKKKVSSGFFQEVYNITGSYTFTDNSQNIYFNNENKNILNINFNKIESYTNSFFGIEIPKLNYKEIIINDTIKYNCYLESYNKIYLYDYKTKSQYLFDLYINDFNKYKIETQLNNFLFIQTLNFILSTLFQISLRHIIINNLF
jgi:hypothetical protein